MKLIKIIDRSPFRKPLITGFILIGIAILFSVAGLIYSFYSAKQAALSLELSQKKNKVVPAYWQNQETQKLWKEKLWIANRLLVSKEDSMTLSINLEDSIVLLQFKGLTLVKTKIGFKFPKKFLPDINSVTYTKLFGNPGTIISERANIVKKPFHKVNASKASDTTAFLKKVRPKRFSWSFITDNKIHIVIHGYDSLEMKIHPGKDILKFRIKSEIKNPLAPYTPTLFIWINNKDATDIYRALPVRAKVIILD